MTDRNPVLILCPLPAHLIARLEPVHDLHRLDLARSEAERRAVIARAGATCRAAVTSGKIGLAGVPLEELPALELLASYSAGYEGVDLPALDARGVALTTTSNALADDVADTALMLMLAARRDLRRADLHVRNGDWARQGMYPLQPAMKGARLGLVGAGRIGQAIARRAEALGMQTAYFGRRARPDVALRYEPDLVALAGWADLLVVAIAGGPDTRHLVDARVLAALGPQGTLVNIARGSIIDEAALIEALTRGTIANAGLDVFQNEPDPDPRLVALPNVTLYPHHASGTIQTRDAMGQAVAGSLAAFFAGEALADRVR